MPLPLFEMVWEQKRWFLYLWKSRPAKPKDQSVSSLYLIEPSCEKPYEISPKLLLILMIFSYIVLLQIDSLFHKICFLATGLQYIFFLEVNNFGYSGQENWGLTSNIEFNSGH